jgi:hypothetical protein
MEFLPDASTRINGNLSSTLRLFVLDFYRSQGSSEYSSQQTPPWSGRGLNLLFQLPRQSPEAES